jgi:hypothetical protein
MNKFDDIQAMLGLTDKEKSQVLSINMNNDPEDCTKKSGSDWVEPTLRSMPRKFPLRNIWLTPLKKRKNGGDEPGL